MNDYQQTISQTIFNRDTFIRAVFGGLRRGQTSPWVKVTIRPVIIKAQQKLQFTFFDGKQTTVKNHGRNAATKELDDLLQLPFRNYHLTSSNEIVQINFSKKGKIKINRQAAGSEQTPDLAHDRKKSTVLQAGEVIPYLQLTGIMTQDGKIKSNMQSKFKQINEFLRLLSETGALETFDQFPVQVVDLGCGNAYLTFALYHYLTEKLGIKADMTGVDIKEHLMERHNKNAVQLGWDGLRFENAYINDYSPSTPPDMVVALHACDTATDDAIAQGIRWNSKIIVTAPCCHHNLQAQMSKNKKPAPFAPLLRYGMFHERIGDLLTDTFRSLILRIMGYRVDVVDFVAAEHTPKNLMIRAVKTSEQINAKAAQEYVELWQFWSIQPYLGQVLEQEMGDIFNKKR